MTEFKFSKKEEREIDKQLKETLPLEIEKSNIGQSSLSTVPKTHEVAVSEQFKGVNIGGLESIPASMVAVPYCRLIQPTSKKTIQSSNGQDARLGSFFFNDIQESVPELNFVLLRAKHELKQVDKDGQFVTPDYIGELGKPKPVVSILGITTDTDKLFILSISATSFSSFGKLIAKLKSLQIDKTWRFSFKATSEKMENAKGKFYVVNFEIGEELKDTQSEQMQKTAQEYGVVLDRQVYEEEV